MSKGKTKWYLLVVLFLFGVCFLPFTFSKYTTKISELLTLNARQPEYDVVFYHPLPSGYQEVAYIKSTGNQYIDTGITPSNTLKTEVVYVDTSATGSNYVLGSRTEDYGSIIHYGLVGSSNDSSIAAYYNTASNNQQKFSVTRVADEKYHATLEIEYDEIKGYRMHSVLNDITANTTEEKYSPYFIDGIEDNLPNIYVFAIKPGNVHRGMELYSLKFWEAGVLIGDFVPCYRIEDNVIGLYDMVAKTFHPNNGGGTLLKGENTSNEYYAADSQHFNYGNADNLKANTRTKIGYTFIEWNTSPDGTGTIYTDEQLVNNLTSVDGSKINLYSQWEPITYNVNFYPNTPGSPSGYTRLEYIESDGKQYINTGFTPNQDTRIIADFEYTSGYRFFGSEQRSNNTSGAASTKAFRFGKSSQGKWYISYGTQGTRSVGNVDTNRHIIDFNKNNFYVDNELLYSYNYETFTAWGEAYIFNINHNYFSITDSPARAKLYSLKIYDNGTLTRDYIPCMRDSDGAVGLYDEVNNTFIASTGTSSLAKGIKTQVFTYDVSDDLMPNTYSTIGYAFSHWNTSPDGTGTSYDDEEIVMNLASTKDAAVNLYAQWTRQYLLTVSAGNGIQNVSQNGWTNSGMVSMSKYFTPNETVDLTQITPTYLLGYEGASYTITSGSGNLVNGILNIDSVDTIVTINAASIVTPNNPTISGGSNKVYGYQNNNLTCATTSIYDSNVTLHYSYGYTEDQYVVPSINNASIYDEITIGTEKFYLIERSGNTITLLTKYGINTSDYSQSQTNPSSTIFTGNPYWNAGVGTTYPGSYTGSPKPYVYDSNSLLYNPINRYAEKIAGIIDVEVTGKLMSYEQATAITSPSVILLQAGAYWLGSAGNSSSPYNITASGTIGSNYVQSGSKVRPIIIFDNYIESGANMTPGNWSQYSTSNTYIVPMEYKGSRYYSCKVYAEDSILTSSEGTSNNANSTEAEYHNARINFDAVDGQLIGINKAYVEYGSSNIFTSLDGNELLDPIPFSTKQDYDFAGWWTAPTGGIEVINRNKQVVANATGFTNSNGEWIITNPTNSDSVNILYAHYTESAKTLYNVLKKEANIGTYAKSYASSHQDAIDSSRSTESIYHWYGSSAANGDTILTKNNVVFADLCWQMIRTTDTGGVKLLYNGLPIITEDVDGKHYDCSTTRSGTIGSVLVTQSLNGNYLYGSGYTTSVSGNTTTYTLTDTQSFSISSSNASTQIPNIIENYPYTCKTTSDTCTTLYKVNSYSSGVNVGAYASTYRDAIGSSAFNSTASSIAYVGYMYSNRPTSSSTDLRAKTETILVATTLTGTTYTNYQNYIFGDGYSLSGNNHILTNQTKGNLITDYPGTWVNWYYCASSTSGTCSSMYYVSGIDTSGTNPILYRATIGSGQTADSAANKYLFGDTLVDNGDGTFSLSGNVREIAKKDWYSSYSSLTTGFVCFPNQYTYNSVTGENSCYDTRTTNKVTAIGNFTATTATNFTYYPVYKYGNNIALDSGTTYKLVGDGNATISLQYIYNWNSTATSNCFTGNSNLSTCGYRTLTKSHYTCYNLSGKCSTYYHINYTTTSYAYNVTLSGGKKVSTDVTDSNNILYDALYNNVNNTNSTIKGHIDNWYRDTLYDDYDEYIDDIVYCNDRKIASFGGWDSNASTYSNYSLKFRAQGAQRDLSCPNATDRFSASNSSASLTYKVGLITTAEVNLFNQANIRASASSYWLMTPYAINDYRAINYFVSNTGTLSVSNPVSTSYTIRPVISLIPSIEYSKGNGSTTDPYVVDLNSINSP